MKKILFLNGLTEHAPDTYLFALKIAAHFQTSLTLLHVFDPPTPTLLENDMLTDLEMPQQLVRFAEDQKKARRKEIEQFVKQYTLPAFQAVPREIVVEGGDLLLTTVQWVKKSQPDLLVMGLHHHNRFMEIFHASLPNLADHLSCPILFVPPEAHYSGFLNLLYVTDGNLQRDAGALQQLLQWAEAFRSQVHVLLLDQELEPDAVSTIRTRWAGAMDNTVTSFHWIQNDSTKWDYEDRYPDAIMHYADRSGADLIVLHAHHQGFWGRLLTPSAEKEVMHRSTIPILLGKWED